MGQTLLASQNVQVTGAVYRLADPLLDTTSVTLAARVGDALPSASVSVTNSSPDAFTEGLDAAFGAAPAGFTATGSVTNLAAGATDGSSLSVGLTSTASSQNLSSSVAVEFESTGAGTTGEADVSVGSTLVSLAGKVYEKAVALVQQVVDFGIVHVGELVAALGVSVTNDAPGAALNDTLTGSIGGASGPFTAVGNLGTGLLAGVTDTSSLGVEPGYQPLRASSPELPRPACSATTRTWRISRWAISRLHLMAQVNNYANADLAKAGGGGSFGGGWPGVLPRLRQRASEFRSHWSHRWKYAMPSAGRRTCLMVFSTSSALKTSLTTPSMISSTSQGARHWVACRSASIRPASACSVTTSCWCLRATMVVATAQGSTKSRCACAPTW